jgi:hypothetical protein
MPTPSWHDPPDRFLHRASTHRPRPKPSASPPDSHRRATHCSNPVTTVPMMPHPYPFATRSRYFLTHYPFFPISIIRSALHWVMFCRHRCRRRLPLPAILLCLRIAAVWSTSLSRHSLKEAPKPPATSSPSAVGSVSSWSAFSIHSLTLLSHP